MREAYEEEMPLESDVQFDKEIVKVKSKSVSDKTPNYAGYREMFNEDLSKANFSPEQERHAESILEVAMKTINFAERHDRDMSHNLNHLTGLIQGKAIISRGRNFTAVRTAKTQYLEQKQSKEETFTAEDKSGKKGVSVKRELGFGD